MARKRAKTEDQGVIDLTPMLDVVFIMLIFFIVTASFIKETGIEVERPDATTAEQKKKAKILIAISSQNEVWIDKNQVDIRSVKAHIERLHAENPKSSIVVQTDNKANIKTLTEVVEAAKEVGVPGVAVATEHN